LDGLGSRLRRRQFLNEKVDFLTLNIVIGHDDRIYASALPTAPMQEREFSRVFSSADSPAFSIRAHDVLIVKTKSSGVAGSPSSWCCGPTADRHDPCN
jgi:hypothetical protein